MRKFYSLATVPQGPALGERVRRVVGAIGQTGMCLPFAVHLFRLLGTTVLERTRLLYPVSFRHKKSFIKNLQLDLVISPLQSANLLSQGQLTWCFERSALLKWYSLSSRSDQTICVTSLSLTRYQLTTDMAIYFWKVAAFHYSQLWRFLMMVLRRKANLSSHNRHC